jgi:1-acyl-sn-glycerol-3-phosphate acyltransferase
MRPVHPLFYLAYQPYKFLWLFLVMVLATILFGSLAVVFSLAGAPKLAGRWWGRSWARVIAFFTPISVTVEGLERLNPRQSYVIVANHQSAYDIFVVYGWLPMDFKWVMKKELRHVPFLGTACHAMGHVFVDRRNRESALASLSDAEKKITNGTSILFFPEGTRRRSKRLTPFKKGAFYMAKSLNLPLLPVTLLGTDAIQPSRSLDVLPGKAVMIFHEPLWPKEREETIDELIDRTKAVIASALPEDRR